MATGAELRGLAMEAFERSERAALLMDVQWFLKLRRVLTEAADELDVPPMVRAQGAKVVPFYPNVSGEQYERERGR